VAKVALDALKNMPWWGKFELSEVLVDHWRLGSLHVWIESKPGEWRVHARSDNDPFDQHAHHERLETFAPPDRLDDRVHVTHVAAGKRSHSLTVTPRLADRDVVARPETATVVVQKDAVDFWVTTPLFVSFEADSGQTLLELPTFRPSDTWFGDITEGELCYASRVAAYTHLSRLKFSATRAVTRITVRNNLDENLTLERLRLPTPTLSLYVDEEGNFWTQDVTITVGDDEQASIRSSSAPPAVEGGVRMVCGPRRPSGGNLFVRALSKLLS
jgi:hypothetical protein